MKNLLEQLNINNIAIIDRTEIAPRDGFNVLTGETGAGKSIIIDSINAILGERASKELIRTGSDKALVEAVFRTSHDRLAEIFENYGLEFQEDNSILLQREFSLNGKNNCRVNGRLVTVSVLREIGQKLIDIHGQHDNQSLLRVDSHIDLLDKFAGENIEHYLYEYSNILEKYKKTKERFNKLTTDAHEKARRIDLLSYETKEIDSAKLIANEDEELEKKRLTIANAEKIRSSLQETYNNLHSGNNSEKSALDSILKSVKSMQSILLIDSKYELVSQRIQSIGYELQDCIEIIRDCIEETDFSPEESDVIVERLDLIRNLKRKYGATISEILEYEQNANKELNDLQGNEAQIDQIINELKNYEIILFEIGEKIHNLRVLFATQLEAKITSELADLEMKGTKFKVNIEWEPYKKEDAEAAFMKNGLDRVEFFISVNEPAQLKPLAKVASGGEMSRIMLAIKTILASVDAVPTLIFDEIDVGISGRAAQKVANKLAYIAKNHQVLCVTHLAQIAAKAKHHYLIEKSVKNNNTCTGVKKLTNDERKNELARIIGGDTISEITIKLAEEMLENASESL